MADIEGEVVRRGRGRPKKVVAKPGRPFGDGYHPKMAEELVQMRAEGKTVTQCIWELGNKYGFRARQTYYNYIKEHPEFAEAHEWGYTGFQAKQEEIYQEIISEGGKGGKDQLMFMNNTLKDDAFGEGWKYSPNQAGNNITVNGNITQQIMQLPSDELATRLNELMQKKLEQAK